MDLYYNSGSFSGSLSNTELNLLYDRMAGHSGVEAWLENCVNGYTLKVYKNLQKEWTSKLIDDPSVAAISASKDDFINQVINHPDYQNAETVSSASLAQS